MATAEIAVLNHVFVANKDLIHNVVHDKARKYSRINNIGVKFRGLVWKNHT
jgi:hypothetical protein